MVNTRSGAGVDHESRTTAVGAPCSVAGSVSSCSSASSVAVAKGKEKENFLIELSKLQRKIDDAVRDINLAGEDLSDVKEELEKNKEILSKLDPAQQLQEVQEKQSEIDQLKKKKRDLTILRLEKDCKVKELERQVDLLRARFYTNLHIIDEEAEMESCRHHELDGDLDGVKDDGAFEFCSHQDEVNKDDHVSVTPPVNPTLSTEFAQVLGSALGAAINLSNNQKSQDYGKFFARQTTGKDLPTFSGAPDEWPIFIADYSRTTQLCEFSPDENLQRLRKCLRGEAAKAVQCLMLTPENLPKIMETLKRRFGNEEHIITSMIDAVRSTPPIREDKLETVIEMGTAVVNLIATVKSLNCDHHLQNPTLLLELRNKLPAAYKMQFSLWTK